MSKTKKFYETEKFKKLQARWYAKLEKDGFVDIEKSEDEYMVRPEVFNAEPLEYSGGTDYRLMCEEILEQTKFRTEIHRQIFKLHAAGLSERQIEKQIEDEHGTSFKQQVINRFIRRTIEDYKKGITK